MRWPETAPGSVFLLNFTGTDGRPVDAETVAEWSARVDLSQALWVNASNFLKEFTEAVGDEEALQQKYFVSASKLHFPPLPSAFVEVVETNYLTEEIVITHVRLRPEQRLAWALRLTSDSWTEKKNGEARQATMKLFMEEIFAEDSLWTSQVLDYADPDFSILSRYSTQPDGEMAHEDSVVYHPVPGREE